MKNHAGYVVDVRVIKVRICLQLQSRLQRIFLRPQDFHKEITLAYRINPTITLIFVRNVCISDKSQEYFKI